MKILDEICEVITCGVAKRPEYVSSGIPFLSSKNVKKDRFILDHYNFISENDYQQLTKHNKPEKGDVLYTRVGSFGEAAVVDFDFKFAVFVSLTLIKPKHNIVNARYLMHYLNSPDIVKLAESSTSGIGVQNLNVNVVRKFPINLPPLPQQQKIANILDAADTLRQNDKALIAKYDELTQALFLNMFGDPVSNPKGWEKYEFSKVAKNENSKRVPVKQSDRDKREGEYPYYGATGIIDTIDDYKFDGEFLLIAEDGKNLLFRKKNNAFIAKGKFWVNNHAHVLSTNGITDLKYLEFFLNSIDFGPYISGIDQIKLNKESLNKIPVPVPPINLQNKFAERVAAIEEQKSIAQKSLEKSESLFNSLLQKAFKGELV